MTIHDIDMGGSADPSTFLGRLTLQRIDRDIFTGWCHAGSPTRAFGGQVAAQALVAAGSTVEQPGRVVHSLHAYFLRPGRTTDHILYVVDRLRDGRSFSTRRVRAVQYGETIFAMSASYSQKLPGPEHQIAPHGGWIAEVPSPDGLPRVDELSQIELTGGPREDGRPSEVFVDLRFIDTADVRALPESHADRMAWVRAAEPLGDQSLVHVCALTYFSDLSLVSTVLDHYGDRERRRRLQIASLDHAMWFHRPFRADEWLLFVTDSPTSGDGHGFARGKFYRPDGTLVASAAQEVLVRDPAT